MSHQTSKDRVPDAKTLWLFRERIKQAGMIVKLFSAFRAQLAKQGCVARSGQMIDATFVEVTRPRNTREENASIKEGETQEEWQTPQAQAKLRQKNVDARWTKKSNERNYGYKNHVNADQDHKQVRSFDITDTAVHDSQVFEVLIDKKKPRNADKRAVYADSAYRSQEKEAALRKAGKGYARASPDGRTKCIEHLESKGGLQS
jgi:IS5 family transposase